MKPLICFLVTTALTLNSTLAAPFVWPAAWTATSPGEAKPGGILRIANIGEFTTINPFSDASNLNLWDFIRGYGLLMLDPITFRYVPYMAESYTVSKDQTTWTFKLRSGMKWSDGQPIVADDFVTALAAARATSYSLADDFEFAGKGVQVVKLDAATLKVVFPTVSALAAERISYLVPRPNHIFGPVLQKSVTDIRKMWSIFEDPKTIVTAGPFMFSRHVSGERTELVRNPYFGEWNRDAAGKPLPYLDGLSIQIYPDFNAQLAKFISGELDFMTPRTPDQLALIKEWMDGGKLKAVLKPNIGPVLGSSWLVFNWNRRSDPEKQRLFRSSDFRRAIAHLIDHQSMVEVAFGGFGQARYTSVPASFTEWISPTLSKYEYNPQTAKTLLAKLGYSKRNAEGYLVNREGRPLEFNLITTAPFLVYVNLVVETLKEAGIKVYLNIQPNAAIVAARNSQGEDRSWDAIMFGGNSFDLEFPLGANYYACRGDQHVFNMSGRCLFPWETQVTALMDRGVQETERAKRIQIAHQIQDIWSLHQPFIYLPRANLHLSWNARVVGEYTASAINTFNFDREPFYTTTWIR